MKLIKRILIPCLLLINLNVIAEEYPIKLEKPVINTHDVKSIQRGAKTFASTCLVCHSMDYLAHDRIAKAAGITPNKMPDKNQKWWFGAAPPDLTLVAKVRGARWLYTYLHVFYKDPKQTTGFNNLLLDNSNMPNPFVGMQGEQQLIAKKTDLFSDASVFTRKLPYYSVLTLSKAGSMPPDEFDAMIKDLVNFLVYASEPKKYTRERLGVWVLLFLGVLFILVYLLKRSYWKQLK
ncbi:MAG: cytochrome c1 [Gammaproteobacteria bacterium]|nr:cytochrome c1 [Gammaproteobacteria bacterium]